MRWIVVRNALLFSLSSSLMIWLFLGISDTDILRVRHKTINQIPFLKFPTSEQLHRYTTSERNVVIDNHVNKKNSFNQTISSYDSFPVTIYPTQQKRTRQSQRTFTTKDVDAKEQLKKEIYGNNYLEELVLIGTNTDALYVEMAQTQEFGHCSNWSEDKECSPLLNLLLKGFRYFELTASFDQDTRFYYWHLSENRRRDTQLREVSKDVREICSFAKSHAGEMIMFSLAFCSSDCHKFESEKYEYETQPFDGGDSLQWTNLYNRLPETIKTQTPFNGSFYSNPNFVRRKFNLVNSWYTNEKRIVENPMASRFLSIVGSFVKSCALLGDVPLTRTVSEMLMLKRNVIFTVRYPNFVIPLTLQRIFRHDEILRKTILSEWNIKTHKKQLNNFDWLFPDITNLETINIRFFSQPSTLSHLRLIFTENEEIAWFNKWKSAIIFPSGCTMFDISLVILMTCLLLMIVKNTLRKSTYAGMKYSQPTGKLNLFKKSSLQLSSPSSSSSTTSSSSSVVIIYSLYVLFLLCFLLANLYAYQCFSRVILPFSHREVQHNLTTDEDNFCTETKDFTNSSNGTSVKFKREASSSKTSEDEICDSIIWTFRRWLGRSNGKRVNIVSAVAKFQPQSSLSKLFSFQNRSLLNSTSLLKITEFNICTRELVEFASKINYNQIPKYILIKHSGSPDGKNPFSTDCAPVIFCYSVSFEGKNILTGLMKEGDELILEDDKLPRNTVLNIHVLKHNSSLRIFLYSELVDKLMKYQTDVYLKGTRYESSSGKGFAYVSNRSDVKTVSCQMQDLPRDLIMRLKSWNE